MDAVVGVAVVLAPGFVPAPLVIDEDDREALDRTRPGVRDLAGGEAESREDDAATRRERRSPRCDRPAQDPLRLLWHVCPAGAGAATVPIFSSLWYQSAGIGTASGWASLLS